MLKFHLSITTPASLLRCVSKVPLLALRVIKATCRLSGDHSNEITPPGALVSFVGVRPGLSTIQTCGAPSRVERKAIRLPSGDQRAASSLSVGKRGLSSLSAEVRGTGWLLPSVAITQMDFEKRFCFQSGSFVVKITCPPSGESSTDSTLFHERSSTDSEGLTSCARSNVGDSRMNIK